MKGKSLPPGKGRCEERRAALDLLRRGEAQARQGSRSHISAGVQVLGKDLAAPRLPSEGPSVTAVTRPEEWLRFAELSFELLLSFMGLGGKK